MLTWKELVLLNKQMHICGLLRFLREAEVIPHLIGDHELEEICVKILVLNYYSTITIYLYLNNIKWNNTKPPTNNVKVATYYNEGKLKKVYDLDRCDLDHSGENILEPTLYFYEFQFILARIAIELYRDNEGNIGSSIICLKKIDPSEMVKKFFKDALNLRTKEELETKPFPNLNKKFLSYL